MITTIIASDQAGASSVVPNRMGLTTSREVLERRIGHWASPTVDTGPYTTKISNGRQWLIVQRLVVEDIRQTIR
jgi:hypothetical protein